MKNCPQIIRFAPWCLLALVLTACGGAAAKTEWMTDAQAAMKEAKLEDRPILLEFTGSDWCPPCQKMDEEVLNTAEFKAFSDKNLALLQLDYPKSKTLSADLTAQNASLAKNYNISDYPTFVLLDKNGIFIDQKVGYTPGGPATIIGWIKDKGKIQ